MPHSALYIKKLGFFKAQAILLKDWMKPKIGINSDSVSGGYDARRHYPPTNLQVAEEAHRKHIESLKNKS